MEVGTDVSTQRPLLDEDEDALGPNVDSTAPVLASTQQAWRQRGRHSRDVGYGLLEEPAALIDDHTDSDDEGEVEAELLQRVEDGFYECEENRSSDEEDCINGFAPSSPPDLATCELHGSDESSELIEATSTASDSAACASVLQPAQGSAREMRFLHSDPTPCESIEMRDLVLGEPTPSPEYVVSNDLAISPSRGMESSERHCFICLLDEEKDQPLISCCTTCYASVHVSCWREWRNNQRITALRSRLLGLRMQTNNLLRCSICKSGTAVVAGEEEDGLEWMHEFLSGGGDERGNDRAPVTPFIGAEFVRRRDDSDEDTELQLGDLADVKTCLAIVVYLVVLLLVIIAACVLIVMQRFYAGDVILCCIIGLYELSVLQVVALAIARRRASLLGAAAAQGQGVPPPEGPDLERGR
jgi:hypothetical protein